MTTTFRTALSASNQWVEPILPMIPRERHSTVIIIIPSADRLRVSQDSTIAICISSVLTPSNINVLRPSAPSPRSNHNPSIFSPVLSLPWLPLRLAPNHSHPATPHTTAPKMNSGTKFHCHPLMILTSSLIFLLSLSSLNGRFSTAWNQFGGVHFWSG